MASKKAAEGRPGGEEIVGPGPSWRLATVADFFTICSTFSNPSHGAKGEAKLHGVARNCKNNWHFY
jgi:hypothetical protein